MLTQPSISGTAKVGETLTADAGTWAEGPTFSYQWRSCDKNGAGCNDIAGANGQSYGVRSSDVGNTIRVRVTAKNLVGSADATSSEPEIAPDDQ